MARAVGLDRQSKTPIQLHPPNLRHKPRFILNSTSQIVAPNPNKLNQAAMSDQPNAQLQSSSKHGNSALLTSTCFAFTSPCSHDTQDSTRWRPPDNQHCPRKARVCYGQCVGSHTLCTHANTHANTQTDTTSPPLVNSPPARPQPRRWTRSLAAGRFSTIGACCRLQHANPLSRSPSRSLSASRLQKAFACD